MGLFDRLMQPQAPRRNLMDTQMVRRPSESYLRQDYPIVYGALGGLLGTAPDEMSGSVLDPSTAAVRRGAEYGFPVGTALGMLPAARLTKGLPVGMGIKDVGSKFNVASKDASEIFGAGSARFKYTEPNSGGSIEVLRKSDGSASVLSLEVPEKFRGMKIGESLQAQVMQDFPVLQGQVSSKAAAKTAYRLGRRPPNQPDASLDEVYKIMDEYSSVNLVSPAMQRQVFMPTQAPQQAALDLAQQRAALPVSEGGLGLPVGMGIKDVGESPFVVYRGGTKGKAIATEGLDPGSVQLGQGAYFGSSKGMAEEFAKYRPEGVVEAYHLNLKTPFDETAKIIPSTEQMQALRKNLLDIGVPKIYVDELEQPYRGAITNLSDAFSKKLTRQGKPTTNWQAADKINAAIRKSGFDGIIADVPEGGEQYVAFSKNQFKPLSKLAQESTYPQQAALDPFRKSAAIAATMGVAAPDLLANELDYPSNPMYTDPLGYSIR